MAEQFLTGSEPWADDRALVERIVDKMIVNAAREGVSLDEERTLPTAP
jgi:hypothetical protein